MAARRPWPASSGSTRARPGTSAGAWPASSTRASRGAPLDHEHVAALLDEHVVLIAEPELEGDDPAPGIRGGPRVGHPHARGDGVPEADGRAEAPVDAEQRDGGPVDHTDTAQEAARNREAQEAVGDALAEGRLAGEDRVRMNRVTVARKRRERHDIGLRHGP